MEQSKRVVLAGASGLVGNELLKVLLEERSIGEVVLLLRKEIPVKHEKIKQIIVDFEDLERWSTDIYGDAIFCCLGSTRNKTPEKEDYEKVDLHYPLLLAKIGKSNNVPQFHLISAMGASSTSSNFYLSLKGKVEEAIKEIHIKNVHYYRPSLLVGNRKEFRLGEKAAVYIMKILNPILVGPLQKYQSIDASKVARAMFNQFAKNLDGLYIYQSDEIKELA